VLPKSEGQAGLGSLVVAMMMMMMMILHVVFARKSLGTIASSYTSSFVHRRDVLDMEYDLRKIGNRIFMVNYNATLDTKSDHYIIDKHFKSTRVSGT
jgi:hypothetical protein